jgi:two-component system CheB/CheR fusion protein
VKNNEERIAHLARELDHRVKNILNRFAVVIDRTGDAPLGKEEFVAALKQRIESMARTHSLLSRTNWSGAPLDALILDQLEAYATAKNLDISGEPVVVTPDAAQSLSMVFNELATNAAKYGALSVPSGQVRVRWHRERRADGEALVIAWQEQEGPTVAPPATEGYGTSVIRGLLAHEFAAAVNLAMLAAGVHCVITLPVVGVVTDS